MGEKTSHFKGTQAAARTQYVLIQNIPLNMLEQVAVFSDQARVSEGAE